MSRNRQIPSDTQTFVPTAAMRAGDFTDVASAGLQRRDGRDPGRAVREQPRRSGPLQSGRAGAVESPAGGPGSVRAHHLRRARQQRRAAERGATRLAGDRRPALLRPLFHRQLRPRARLRRQRCAAGERQRPGPGQPCPDDLAGQRLHAPAEPDQRDAVCLGQVAHPRSQGSELPSWTDLGSDVWSAAEPTACASTTWT